MARYMTVGWKKYTRKKQEGFVYDEYGQAYADALDFLKSGQYKVILVLKDDEGLYHPANAGKFSLYRIVKWEIFQHVKLLLS